MRRGCAPVSRRPSRQRFQQVQRAEQVDLVEGELFGVGDRTDRSQVQHMARSGRQDFVPDRIRIDKIDRWCLAPCLGMSVRCVTTSLIHRRSTGLQKRQRGYG